MRSSFLIFLFSFQFSMEAFSQQLQFDWANSIGSNLMEEGRAVTLDAQGNSYFTGIFRDTMDADTGSGSINLISNGNHDVFITKRDIHGNIVWAKSFGGSVSDWSESIQCDESG